MKIACFWRILKRLLFNIFYEIKKRILEMYPLYVLETVYFFHISFPRKLWRNRVLQFLVRSDWLYIHVCVFMCLFMCLFIYDFLRALTGTVFKIETWNLAEMIILVSFKNGFFCFLKFSLLAYLSLFLSFFFDSLS